MEKTTFSVLSIAQDVKIESTITKGENDSLNSYLSFFVSFLLRRPTKEITFDIISLSAKLLFQNPKVILSEKDLVIGINVDRDEWQTGEWLNFKLEEKAINLIEKYRNGDVFFEIQLTILIQVKSEFTAANSKAYRSGEGLQKFNVNHLYSSISKSKWVEEVLSGLGYQNLKLIEIPLTHKTLKEAYSDIIFEFNNAEEYFNQQDYNKCVAHCRSTLDALNRNLKKIKEQKPSESVFKWLENIDVATYTWIDEMDKSSVAIASKPHHSGHKRDFSRQEAESIYLVVLGLLNFVGHINQ